MLHKMIYFIRQAFKNMYRSLLMTLVAAGTIAITLIVLGTFSLLAVNLNRMVDTVESRLELAVFLEDDLSEQEVWQIKERLTNWDLTHDVRYISRTEALDRLKAGWSGDAELLDIDDDNPLPNSLEARISEPHMIEEIAAEVQNWAHVEDVSYGQGIIGPLFTAANIIRLAALGLIVLTGGAAVLIIANTIRLTVHARRREIEIMKFVGATNWFIRCPFLFEGFLLGFLGAVISTVVVSGSYGFAAAEISRRLPFLPLLWDLNFLIYFNLFLVLTGIFLGGLGSMMAVTRYIDV